MPATPTATQAPTSSKLKEGHKLQLQKLGTGLIIKVFQGQEAYPTTKDLLLFSEAYLELRVFLVINLKCQC